MTSVFSNINCVILVIDKMSLGPLDTQALVGAMDTRVEEINLHEGVTLDLETLTQYDGTGKCEFLRTWNIKCNNLPWLEDQEDAFEDYNYLDEWVEKLEVNWMMNRYSLIANYIEIYIDPAHNYSDTSVALSYFDIYGEDEESFEVDDNEEDDSLNSDDEVENVLNNDSEEEEAGVDSVKNDVKEDLEIVKKQIHQDVEEDEVDTDLNLGSAAAGSAGQYFVDQATGQYYFQSSNDDMVQLEDADAGVEGRF